jgi:hypothetical protein
MYELMIKLRALEAVETCYPFGQYHHVVFGDGSLREEDARQIVASVSDGMPEVKRTEATIEDCFMDLMHQ